MSDITLLREKFASGQVEFSKHAVDNTLIRRIKVSEIQEVIATGEVIEDYPEDHYGPSCLIFGYTKKGRPLHIQTSYPQRNPVKVITLYEPTSERWLADFKTRKR